MENTESDSHKNGRLRKVWPDLLALIFLATIIASIMYSNSQRIPAVLSHEGDVWFESDTRRVIDDMTNRSANHWRTNTHPLFPLVTYIPTKLVMKVFRIKAVKAAMIVIAALASIWISTLYVLLRLIGIRSFEAMLFSLLGIVSAASIFWFAVPETYSFGSLSILLVLVIVVLSQKREISSIWYAIVSALSLSFTVTNWSAGIVATFVNFPWKKALQITVNAFCIVIVLWSVQRQFFSRVLYFGTISSTEKRYIMRSESGGPINVAKSFIFHTIVMPAIQERQKVKLKDNTLVPIMVTQPSKVGSASLYGAAASWVWIALLGFGFWGFIFSKDNLRLRLVLAIVLLGQFSLHLLYGQETFLYSLHFVPLMIVLVAFSTMTRARSLALALTGILIVLAAINNLQQFDKAMVLFAELTTP
jgi:hypothetical protein